jgi:bifunctional UDP-N-acetylglucosamine pyrophosphorylase / glucosamine-1-phosphate N-acetyltransferase
MHSGLAAIVLAAGRGTRMRSERAKVLHEVAGEPMIVRTLAAIATLEPNPLIVVVGYGAREVEETVSRGFRTSGLSYASYAFQQQQRGTGDAARCGFEAIPEDFRGDVIIAYGDMPRIRGETLRAFLDEHRRRQSELSFIGVKLDDPASYGRVIRDEKGEVRAIVEASDASASQLAVREINTGIYLVKKKFLESALSKLSCDNQQGEYYLTDLVSIACRQGVRVDAWLSDRPAEFAGINSRKELSEMEAEIRQAVNNRLMASGVTLVDPATAYIGEHVEIGRDCVIGPNVQILGKSRIGADVRIEGMAWLRDVSIGDRCHLKIGVRAENCAIGPDCEIGPFANLREGTELEGHNRIGNFVETKKARIGRGTKASHLAYLGDAIIGSETNVGCGVITVNYDGYDKHLTQIGDRCMVGCDSQLVAPVKVGNDVYVASGTTIVRDVPDGALVMSHHPQREKPGWTAGWHQRHRGQNRRAATEGTDED